MDDICVVFDLDDTLYKEIAFLKSAYRNISVLVAGETYNSGEIFNYMLENYYNGEDVFTKVLDKYSSSLTKDDLLVEYRTHFPFIELPDESALLLNYLRDNNIILGILTDGRAITQRNKIKALGLHEFVSNGNILISEEFGSSKPAVINYQYFENRHSDVSRFFYIGDNPRKDFQSPNRLGWQTIGLIDDGHNIHKQDVVPRSDFQPQIWVERLSDLINEFNKII